MNNRHSNALAVILALNLGAIAFAEPAKMNMMTPVPEAVATPDRLKTRLGTLTLTDGVPDAETAQKVYDNLNFQ